ncbi:MAG: linear amide C-N hydrolase [Verrucomicrobiota bacterium]
MKKILSSLVAVTMAAATPASHACTAFQLKSNDGAHIYFRSMEFGFPFNSKALVVPRGSEFTGSAPGGKPGLKWMTKYGYVGMNVDISPSTVADGQNEKGLAVGLLYLPGYSQYLPPDDSQTGKTVGSWEVANYLLGTCASVDEAVAALMNDLYVAQQEFPPFKQLLPVHFWIGDNTGKVVIAEFVGGELKIYDAPLGTLTNSPPYDWQTINIGNYVDLSPVNMPQRQLGEFTSVNFGQGSGALGLPGDMSPPSRFIRASLFSHWATPGATASETVNLGFHILNTFDIFNGAIKSNTADQTANTKGFLTSTGKPQLVNTDTTEWVISHDRTNLKTYIRTYNGLEIQMVDLKKIDFAQPGLRTIDVQNDFAPEDITSQAKPLAAPAN